MKGYIIDSFMDYHGQGYFRGVFSRNKLPNKVGTIPSSFVFNSDKSGGPGEHWVACYFDFNGSGEYFDPYGLPPLWHEFDNFMEKNSWTPWTFSNTALQGDGTKTCGHHCLFYLYHRTRGYSLCDIQTMLLNSQYNMDDIVVQFVNSNIV